MSRPYICTSAQLHIRLNDSMHVPRRTWRNGGICASQIEVVLGVTGRVALRGNSAFFACVKMVRRNFQVLLQYFRRFNERCCEACFDVPFDVAMEEIDAWYLSAFDRH